MTTLPLTGAPTERALLAAGTFLTAEAERGAALRFHTTVVLSAPPRTVCYARLLATAHGVYELRVAGRPVGEDVLSPGWTAYDQRLTYQGWDVTDLVREAETGQDGRTCLDIEGRVGNGWYRGDLGFDGANACYGEQIGLIAALELRYTDRTVQIVTTDPSWTASTCDVVANNLYQGQRTDTRVRVSGGVPLTVRSAPFDHDRLDPQVAEPVRRQEHLSPQRVWTSPSGRTLVDFGQNLVGWVRVEASGPAGTEITLRHAEVLEHGELGTRPLRGARATDTVVLSGTGTDVVEPTFTFHGFRYVEVSGWPTDPTPEALHAGLTAVVVHTDMPRTSSFACSDPRVDRLMQNAVWGQKGNFLALPTDCPQRDERLGWTGDIAVFAPTACRQFDAADLLHSWLLDLLAETRRAGHVPVIVPDVMRYAQFDEPPPFADVGAQAVWSDAAAWVPEALWSAYGDRDRLASHYPGIVAHLESVEPLLSDTGLWDTGMQLADWLDPDAPPDQPWAAKADPGVVATAAVHRSARFAAEAADLLGHTADAARWRALATRLRQAFRTHYVRHSATLRITSDCATVYALALCLGLLDPDEAPAAADRLAEIVAARDHTVTTGFAGTPFVTWALSENGHTDTAYRMLLETRNPSWLYAVDMGATTIWERWDSMLPDWSVNPGEMTSFNHYALGAVADWVHQVVGGIRAGLPGFRRILVQPEPGPGITWARAACDARVGRIETHWQLDGDRFTLHTTIPAGIPADIVLPDGTRHEVTGGQHTFTATCPTATS